MIQPQIKACTWQPVDNLRLLFEIHFPESRMKLGRPIHRRKQQLFHIGKEISLCIRIHFVASGVEPPGLVGQQSTHKGFAAISGNDDRMDEIGIMGYCFQIQ